MHLVCPACARRFAVDDAAVPPHGTQVACPQCQKPVPAVWPAIGLDLEAPAPARVVEEEVSSLALAEETGRAGQKPTSARSRATPRPPAAPAIRVQGVIAAPATHGERWRFIAAVGGTALLAVVVAVSKAWWGARDVAPPEMPNPLAERAHEWRQSGVKPKEPSLADALEATAQGLRLGTPSALKEARVAARSALLYDASDP
ncbi:MAG: zinc-ribbon domain-containing protein, partial [Deltaproteobacteria bacterium]|nr:zinc-ribbon domain-containing protein [Deltaproteobacteria bacterium]